MSAPLSGDHQSNSRKFKIGVTYAGQLMNEFIMLFIIADLTPTKKKYQHFVLR